LFLVSAAEIDELLQHFLFAKQPPPLAASTALDIADTSLAVDGRRIARPIVRLTELAWMAGCWPFK
jgi:hypothetical protein